MEPKFTYLILFGVITFLSFAAFIIAVSLRYHKRNNQYQQKIIALEHQKQQELLRAQIEIQEQTLQHISRELHDNLGQVASLIKINLMTLRLDNPAKSIEQIEDTKDLTRQLIADIKSLSLTLGNDRIIQNGLSKAIEIEIDRLNKTGEFIATYEVQGTIPVIDNDTLVIIYRMVQEVFNNMVKHSGAKHFKVLLSISKNLFTLAFNDDGIGFDIEEKINSPGAGLQNLKNRALVINAQLNIRSSYGNGTDITIELPF